MSSWGAIVDRLIDRMKTVPNVGAVYPAMRLALSEQDFYDWARVEVGGDDRIRAWLVVLDETTNTRWATHDGMVDWDRRAVLRGHFQLEDGQDSETGALAVAEAVCAAIDSDLAATRLNNTVRFGGPCRIIRNEPRLFGIVLCHYVEVECPILTTEQR